MKIPNSVIKGLIVGVMVGSVLSCWLILLLATS